MLGDHPDIPERWKNRIIDLEKNDAVSRNDFAHLTRATTENTTAIKEMNATLNKIATNLAVHKSAIVASAKVAAVGTSFVGVLLGGIAWIAGFLHIGPKVTPP